MITNCNQTKGPNVSLTPDRSICQHYYFLLKVFFKKLYCIVFFSGMLIGSSARQDAHVSHQRAVRLLPGTKAHSRSQSPLRSSPGLPPPAPPPYPPSPWPLPPPIIATPSSNSPDPSTTAASPRPRHSQSRGRRSGCRCRPVSTRGRGPSLDVRLTRTRQTSSSWFPGLERLTGGPRSTEGRRGRE